MLIVASKAKVVVKAYKDMRTGADALDRLSAHVSQVLLEAAKCADTNGRKTIKASDVAEALHKE